jgi:hypothetical protein
MRRKLTFGIFAATLAVGGATLATAGPPLAEVEQGAGTPAAVQRSSRSVVIPDEAAMVLVGAMLIALAGAVRRVA